MFTNWLLIFIGFGLLIKGADLFVNGASIIAKKFGVPSVIVGLTIVAIGTSAPELAVNISSTLEGNANLAAGNIIGSNILNLLFIIGVAALIKPIEVNKSLLKFDFIVMILSSVILLVILKLSNNVLLKISGVFLVSLAIIYILHSIWSVKSLSSSNIIHESKVDNGTLTRKVILGIIGLVVVIYSGDLVVKNAVIIASKLGISDTLIGLTIISLGTSLPELITTITAALKGESGLAVGNVVGSNIFNMLLILGTTAIVNPIQFSNNIMIDLIIYTSLSIAMFFIIKFNKNHINRKMSFLLLLTYIIYIVYILLRS